MAIQEAPVTFKSKVNLVMVPVVVRDRDGHAVGNLRREDFTLRDQGKPQVIAKFSVEKSGGDAGSKTVEAQAEAGGTTAGKPATQNTPAAAQPPDHFIAYVFDDVHLETADLMRARKAALQHMDLLALMDRAAIFTTSGQTTLAFTDDRAKLRDTLERIKPRSGGAMSRDCPKVTYYEADLIENKHDPQTLSVATNDAIQCLSLTLSAAAFAENAAHAAARRALTTGDEESRLFLDTILRVVRGISAVPGQRSIVLVSPGTFLTLDRRLSLPDILDRAIHSNVVINSLDARGLNVIYSGGDIAEFGSDPRQLPEKAFLPFQSDIEQSAILGELADGTGGTWFHNNNDLAQGFQRLGSRPEYIYYLGFAPQNLKADGKYHKLKIEVRNASALTMQARHGYNAPTHAADPAQAAKQEIQDALFSSDEMHDLPVHLQTQFFKSADASAKLAVLARVDLKGLRFHKEAGRNRNDLTVVFGLFDRNGNCIGSTQKVVQMRVKDETLAGSKGFEVKASFDVTSGSYLIRMVARDSEGQALSAENGVVEIP